jgi:glycosyltransferase involved in cell wall biosynthesis
MTPWLSILLPVFGIGPALDTCLQSILDQHIAGIEMVIVDDAAGPEDVRRIEAWCQCRPDVLRVVRHAHNLGVSAARNTLLDEARGTYLWFVDPDDVLEPGALASLKKIVDSFSPDLVMCDFRTFDDSPITPGAGVAEAAVRRARVRTFEGASNELSAGREALVAGLFRTGQLHPWSKVVRRAIWPASLRFPAGRVFEDLAVFPHVALAARTHFHAPEVWISYRQRAGSALASLDDRKLDDWTMALTGFAGALQESPLRPDADMLFEVSHFCARTLLRAVRRHDRMPDHPGAARRLHSYVERWQASSPMDAGTLAHAYRARRMYGRWAQWLWTTGLLARRAR